MPDMPMEKKVEKGQLAKAYLAAKKKHRQELLERSDGNFVQIITWLQDSADASSGQMIIGLARSWAKHLDEEQRLFLLGEISNACDRLGGDPLNDPLPPDQNVFTTCRSLLK